MRLKFGIVIILCFVPAIVFAQNKYIPQDPYSLSGDKLHFSKYLITSPAYMGPNALPVPRLSTGKVNPNLKIGIEYERYETTGGKTQDVFAQVSIPLANGKVALEINYVPYEFFSMDSTLSRHRRTQTGEPGNGTAHGDVIFGTRVQLVEPENWIPNISFGMACRTASGTNQENSRYTDAPGYHFDMAAGKSYLLGKKKQTTLQWYSTVGFYVWQTFIDEYPQNDALLYGFGLTFDNPRLSLSTSIRGYSGYQFNGDHPLILRSELGLKQGLASLILGYEYGVRDYPFDCIRIGLRINGIGE